ncbi:MAG: HAD family hydrolase [Candidatus Woesearchaeota archaeon]
MTKAIIFDLWGTVVETGVVPSPSRQVKYFLRVQQSFPDFIVAFEHSFMTKKFNSLQESFEQVVADFNLRIPDFVYEKLVGTWNKNAILSKMYPDTLETLQELKKRGYKLYLLANIDQFSFEQVNAKFKLDELFDKMYPSFETGLLKANPDSYKQILEENNFKEDEVIMVGDSVDSDIKSAERAGLKGVLVDRKDSRESEDKIIALTDLLTRLE